MTPTITQYESNLEFNLLDLAYDVHAAKQYALMCWAHNHIKKAPGEFISTSELYTTYIADLQIINSHATMPEKTFYKEIQPILLANNLVFGKTRQDGKRGFIGIVYCKQIKNNI